MEWKLLLSFFFFLAPGPKSQLTSSLCPEDPHPALTSSLLTGQSKLCGKHLPVHCVVVGHCASQQIMSPPLCFLHLPSEELMSDANCPPCRTQSWGLKSAFHCAPQDRTHTLLMKVSEAVQGEYVALMDGALVIGGNYNKMKRQWREAIFLDFSNVFFFLKNLDLINQRINSDFSSWAKSYINIYNYICDHMIY